MTLGSRGDVQPYVALAQALIGCGHSAVVCTGGSFEDFVRENGVEYESATLDLMALAKTPEGNAMLNGGIRQIRKTLRFAKEVWSPAFRQSLDDFWRAAQGSDIIVYHPKVLAAVDMANALGIPAVHMPPVPVVWPIPEFPNPALSPRGRYGAVLNRLTYRVNNLADSSGIREINDFRQKLLELPGRKAGAYALMNGKTQIPLIYPVSTLLFKDVSSWEGHVYVPGFFFLEPKEERLPDELERFLDAGAPPVVVTFSSMPLKDPQSFGEMLKAALTQSAERAVVLTGASGLEALKSGDNLLVLPGAPHRLLFSRAKGVLHHGGVGTLAEALRTGVPQCVMPFSVDQPFWAERLSRLKCAVPTLKEKKTDAKALTTVFEQMGDFSLIVKAKEMGEKIRAENAVSRTVEYLERLVDV
ncbi:glycosyltransferase [Eubacteriales bacterium OttesenSCG-928-N13]|nr:glycosyltransferase [Eubacteriales bacterium OttesenSCG-928-N13]